MNIDDRGLSSAVTHSLTMGIATILIAMLLMSSGTMLEASADRSADQGLETVGERIAGELEQADRLAGGSGTVTITATHPDRIAGSSYTVELRKDCDAPLLDTSGEHQCVYLTSDGANAEATVPVSNQISFDETEATGGTIEIHATDGTVTIQ